MGCHGYVASLDSLTRFVLILAVAGSFVLPPEIHRVRAEVSLKVAVIDALTMGE